MEIKDWTKNIEDLPTMEVPALENVYSEMLATAHDLGYTVPDKLLVETQDPAKLREVIVPLHEGIKKFHAGLDKARAGKGAADKQKASPKKEAAKKVAAKKASTPKKQAASAPQKEDVSEATNMATATAKKTTAKKGAKKAAAKKAGKGAKTASAANARTPVARSKYKPEQTITVKLKENPARKGTPVFDRVANLMKHNGKTVGAFLKTELGRSSTLNNGVERGWITIK